MTRRLHEFKMEDRSKMSNSTWTRLEIYGGLVKRFTKTGGSDDDAVFAVSEHRLAGW